MANVKNAKAVNSNHINSKFGEGVILDPVRNKNEQGSGGKACVVTNCSTCSCVSCITAGCGSSNKIKVYQ